MESAYHAGQGRASRSQEALIVDLEAVLKEQVETQSSALTTKEVASILNKSSRNAQAFIVRAIQAGRCVVTRKPQWSDLRGIYVSSLAYQFNEETPENERQ